MIPSRTVFDGWRPEALLAAGQTLRADAEGFADTVADSWYGVLGLAHDGLWTGPAQVAAEGAVEVGRERVNQIVAIATGSAVGIGRFGPQLVEAATGIRHLLGVIESGDLFVADDWVVLPRVKRYAPQVIKALALAAAGFQDQIDPKLTALGYADYDLGNFIRHQVTRNDLGIELPELHLDPRAPQDFTKDPYADTTRGENPELGRTHQTRRLTEHLLGSVVESSTTTHDGITETTVSMLDGSSQVYISGPGGERTEFFDPSGRRTAIRTPNADGTTRIELMREGRSPVIVTERADGTAVADIDGFQAPIPGSQDITVALAAGGMAATESQVTRGLPYLSAVQAQQLQAGAKVAGPGLTILSTALSVATAENQYEVCKAGVAGGVSLGVDLVALATMPEMTAGKAFLVGTGTSLGASTLGNVIGQLVCK
ncbi:hypothetical protein ACWDPV_16535 [Gordonia sp. NPDC003504]|jgi:hypothetical protein